MKSSKKSALYFFEQLFGSKTRVKLLRLFLLDEGGEGFYIREISRSISEHINSVCRELDNLEALGLIQKMKKKEKGTQKIHYKANTSFVLYNELRSLIMKSQLLLRTSLMENIKDIGAIHYLALTGSFTGVADATTDMLIVGRVNQKKLADLIKRFEKELGQEIRYTVMSTKEFLYRHQLTDRFLYTIFENEKIVLIDVVTAKTQEETKDHSRKKIAVRAKRG
ncbi:hypothetical protein KKD19_01545 [Patescibacteria group bacterium]|nr:hypothetical protein [Patescibacteria group bacterium]MBU4511914.1 hypothetical protein [Patescibacteria group bacterium]MCG2692882.1 hypothetical protein [Candidatus Parcubacteria bacterium]